MKVLHRIIAEPERCAYLPERLSRLELCVSVDVTPVMAERLLERGWRRFGFVYFRTACVGCAACVSLRIPVNEFQPSRSHRRTWQRNRDLHWTVGRPVVSESRLALFRRWHTQRETHRGWRPQEMDFDIYHREFALPQPTARELVAAHRDPETARTRPIVVSLFDETPRALSAVYTFYEPEEAQRSPGTLAILKLIEIARARGKRWVYLGYRVAGCPSSEYKSRFRPHELAQGWPDVEQAPPKWTRMDQGR